MKKNILLLGAISLFSIYSFTQTTIELVKDINPNGGSDPEYLTVLNDKLYFVTYKSPSPDVGLWVTDGTEANTHLIKSFPTSGGEQYPILSLAAHGNKLYFSAIDGVNGFELWTSDGTTSGTQPLKIINPTGDSNPYGFKSFNGKVYFHAEDDNGIGLWVSDGTSNGTQKIKSIEPFFFGVDRTFTEYNGKLYFPADDGMNGIELWVTDGTSGGTQMVKDISNSGQGGYPQHLYVCNDNLYFVAIDALNGNELWVTDGTSGGTRMVKDINPNGHSNPMHFVEYKDKLYFSADDGTNGVELWSSDGTENGTNMVLDIYNTGDGGPGAMIVYNDTLYFSGNDGVNDHQLWKSDGTAGGTAMLKNLYPNGIGNPYLFNIYNDKLYFKAVHNDYHLWQTDGSEVNTIRVMPNVAPNTNPLGNTGKFIEYNNSLYFPANYNTAGNELYKLTTPNTAVIKEHSKQVNFNVYPNPTVNSLTIDIEKESQFKIFDLTGKELKSFDVNNEQNTVDISNLSPGIYLVQELVTGSQVKIIKQ